MLLERGPLSTWAHGHEAERNRRPHRGSALGQVCGLRPRVSHGSRIRRGCERTRRGQEDGGREGDTGQRNGGSGHGRCGGDGELHGQVDGVCGVRAPRVRARDGVGSGETADRRAQRLGHSAQTAVRPGQPFAQRSKDKTPTSPDKASVDAGEAFRSVPRGTNGQPLGLLSASYTGARPATLPQTCRSVEGAGRVANASSPQFNFHSKQAMELWTGVSGLTADTGTHRGAAKLPLLLRRALRPRGPPGGWRKEARASVGAPRL